MPNVNLWLCKPEWLNEKLEKRVALIEEEQKKLSSIINEKMVVLNM